MAMKTTKVEFKDHDTKNKATFGEQYTEVECTATIDGQDYFISYNRSPITGELRTLTCWPKDESETNENTLTREAVQDICWDELS